MKFEIVDFPWTHGYSESFVDQDRADQMGRDFPEWDDEVWDRAGKTFNTEYGHKKELTDKVAMPDSISSFIKDLESPEFIPKLFYIINSCCHFTQSVRCGSIWGSVKYLSSR